MKKVKPKAWGGLTKSVVPTLTPDTCVQALLDGLDFSPEDIVNAAAQQATLFVRAADYRIQKMRDRQRVEAAYEVLRAEKAIAIRQAAKDNDDRISENGVNEQLRVNQDLQQVSAVLNTAEELEEHSKLLIDAYRMRRDSLRIIADMVAYGIGAESAKGETVEKMRKVRDELSRKYAS